MQAREGLRRIVQERPGIAQAWRLLAQADESSDHRSARIALEKVPRVRGGTDKRDVKSAGVVPRTRSVVGGLGLTPAQLAELGCDLEMKLAGSPCVARYGIHGRGSSTQVYPSQIRSPRLLKIAAAIAITRSCTMLCDKRWSSVYRMG